MAGFVRNMPKPYAMRQLITILATGLIMHASYAQTGSFHKVIVSPYIQVTFVQGDKESVTIDKIAVDRSKFHVEIQGGTLRLYLDGAKDIPKDQHGNDYQQNHHLYPDHAVIATVVYKKLDVLSVRGEETFLCQSPLSSDEFHLHMYGEANITFSEVHIARMYTTMYGEGTLDIKAGSVNQQYYTCYGEGKINTSGIAGQKAKVIAYGEAQFRVNVSDRIKITSFGEAKLSYMGNPSIVKGLHFGGVDLQRLD